MTSIIGPGGLELEARWDEAVDSGRCVTVLCHPHPLDGGTMNAPLLAAVSASLTAAGSHVLRFNFRGVGQSEGSWGEGRGEVDDVAAAIEAAGLAFPHLPIGISGWSFGATTSLRWQARSGSTAPWVGIAPGIRSYRGSEVPDPSDLEPAERLIIIGDRDQFATVEAMESFAARAGASVRVLGGSDHFFVFRESVVGELVAGHLLGAIGD